MNTAQQEIIPANLTEIKPFSKFESELATMKEANDKAVFNYADPKGNKDARSHIYSIRKVRSALEAARKDAKAAALEYGRTVDSEAKRIEGELNAMIAVHETPLLEIEAKETARIEEIKARVATLDAYLTIPATADSKVWGDELDRVSAFVIDASLAEFMAPASIAKDASITAIKARFLALAKAEDDAKELARLKQEQVAREQREREAIIAREAAEKATKDAQDKAERDRLAVEQEAKRKEQEQAAALQRQQEATAKAEREAEESKQRAIKAEQDAKDRAEKAEREAKAKAERDLSAQLESERQAELKRENNKKHAAKINNEAVAGLVAAGLAQETAKAAITAIAQGKVSHVSIQY